ncbi:membrane protein, partial [Streptomyces sp. 150FB]
MHGPATAGWLLVALCAAAGGYCLLRVRGSDGGERRGTAG